MVMVLVILFVLSKDVMVMVSVIFIVLSNDVMVMVLVSFDWLFGYLSVDKL